MSLVQCAPTFGAGRDPRVVDALIEVLLALPGARLLERDADPAADRTALGFVVDSSNALEAAFHAVVEARERIDVAHSPAPLRPTGAVEHLAFIPLGDGTMAGCTALAHKLGERVGRELEIPVYFFGAAALRPERRALDTLRRDARGLDEALGASPLERAPDAGPIAPHPTAGVIAIGARLMRLAFNVELETGDGTLAAEIARRVALLPGVEAQAGWREDAGLAQVRIGLRDHSQVGLVRVYEEVERLARERGIEAGASELVGLVPRAALPPGTLARTRLCGFDAQRQLVEEILGR